MLNSDDYQSNACLITHLSQILKPHLVYKRIVTMEYLEININFSREQKAIFSFLKLSDL